MNVCYWNIHKNNKKQNKKFNDFLVTMLESYSVDLFCISEFNRFNDAILLNNGYELIEYYDYTKTKFYKKAGGDFVLQRIDRRFSTVISKSKKILLTGVHSYDQNNSPESKRLLCMSDIKDLIDEYIDANGETNVIIFGDFNCMPYDDSVVNEDVFNCVLYRDLLKTRDGSKERYYNPMLLLLSEDNKVYGSYYNDSVKQKNLRWYLLDQIIVNKNADKIMDYKSIKFITKVKDKSLLKNNKPNSKVYSDHLPLYFKIKEARE